MSNNKLIGYVGLSHLGLNYLAASSVKGYKVIGIDIDPKKITKLKKFDIELNEPSLKENIFKNKKKIRFSNDFSLLKKCKIIYISLDVDTDQKNRSQSEKVKKLIKKTCKIINKKAILVVLSQVKPGFMRQINFDSKRLFYQVETLVFGEAQKRALFPERIIIGKTDSKQKINDAFNNYLKKFNCPILKMKYEAAELTKIAINLYLSSTVTLTNSLDSICEKININWFEIAKALRLDKRIGKYAYLKPGLGISGGNLERDINSIIELNKYHKVDTNFFNSILQISHKRKKWVWEKLNELQIIKKKNLNISILGITYKENTNSIKNSPSIYLINKLVKNHFVKAFDPVAKKINNIKKFKQTKSIKEAINNADVLVVMTPWKDFKTINITQVIKSMRGSIIIDPYQVLNRKNYLKNKNTYFSLGSYE